MYSKKKIAVLLLASTWTMQNVVIPNITYCELYVLSLNYISLLNIPYNHLLKLLIIIKVLSTAMFTELTNKIYER